LPDRLCESLDLLLPNEKYGDEPEGGSGELEKVENDAGPVGPGIVLGLAEIDPGSDQDGVDDDELMGEVYGRGDGDHFGQAGTAGQHAGQERNGDSGGDHDCEDISPTTCLGVQDGVEVDGGPGGEDEEAEGISDQYVIEEEGEVAEEPDVVVQNPSEMAGEVHCGLGADDDPEHLAIVLREGDASEAACCEEEDSGKAGALDHAIHCPERDLYSAQGYGQFVGLHGRLDGGEIDGDAESTEHEVGDGEWGLGGERVVGLQIV